MKAILSILLLIFVSCSVSRQGVFYTEMPKSPSLKLTENFLTIKTSNSIKNSALSIYEIQVSVDSNKNEVFVSANQAAGKEFKEIFSVNLSEYKITDWTAYSFYWLDPDKKITKLDI